MNPWAGFIGVETSDPRGFLAEAQADPKVRYVEADPVISFLDGEEGSQPDGADAGPTPAVTPNDPLWGSQYGPAQIRAPLAWDTSLGDLDAAVCILDTGVRYTHQDLAGPRWRGGYDFANGDANPMDDNGHGTHVAGIAAASIGNALGIAGMGNVGLFGVKVLDSAGGGSWTGIANGITWCANNGGPRTVHSMSFGDTTTSQAAIDAIEYAYQEKGHLLVAASGNGYCINCVLFPANLRSVMAVSCTTSSETLCSFSSTGIPIEIAAPGSGILSTYHTSDSAYTTLSGTSMSAPHVSGAAALYWSYDATISNTALRARIRSSGQDLGLAGPDKQFGCGELDVKTLFDGTGNCATAPPPPGSANTVLFSADFEDGSLDGLSPEALWRVTNCRAAGSTYSLAFNQGSCSDLNYDIGNTAGNVGTPVIPVPQGASGLRLRFDSWYQTEDNGHSYDLKLVTISRDGGANLVQLYWLAGDPVATWTTIEIPLTTVQPGDNLRLYFRLNSLDSELNHYPGWFVDNVRVEATVPTGPPGPPTAIAATAGPIPGSIGVSWGVPLSPGGSSLTGYRLERSLGCNGAYVTIATTAPSVRSFEDAGLGDDALSCYRAFASNSLGESPPSAVVSATTWTLPGAPGGLVPDRGPGTGEISLTWDEPANRGGASIIGYSVFGAPTAEGPFALLGTTGASPRSFTETGLGNAQARFYKVAAANPVGEGPASGAVAGRSLELPQAPLSPKAVAGPGAGQIRLTWSANPADGDNDISAIRIRAADSPSGPFVPVATLAASALTFTDSGLGNGETRSYQVTALNPVGEGPASAPPVTATTFRPSSPPRDLVAYASTTVGRISLLWSAPVDSGGTPIQQYSIYRAEHLGGPFNQVGSVPGWQTSYSDGGLSALDVYHYVVRGANLAGDSDPSNIACARAGPWLNGLPEPLACDLEA